MKKKAVAPKGYEWYPKKRTVTEIPDHVYAVIQPILHLLNQGKSIHKDSKEHKQMVELLNNAE